MDIERAIRLVLANTYLKNDCYRRLDLLQDFLSHEQFGEGDKEDWIERLGKRYGETAERDIAQAVGAWGKEFMPLIAGAAWDENLEMLKRAIDSLPVLELYVPTVFDNEQTFAIAGWCRAQVDGKVLLDIHVDANAVGGCSFAWKNELYDFSLDYFLKKHKAELLALIARERPASSSFVPLSRELPAAV